MNNLTNMDKLYVTLLAGGMGKRMQSDLPKVLHKVRGEAMIVRLLKQVIVLNPIKILVVVGKFHDIIKKEIETHINDERIVYVNQEQPLGTGHAVQCTLSEFDGSVTNIILNGDVPMLQYQTIKEIYDYYVAVNSKFLITSINLDNPTGNGRIIMDDDRNFKEIVEEKDCTIEQKKITLVNCGIYICSSDILNQYIPQIKSNNAQAEYYLTDLVKIYKDATNKIIDLFILAKEKEIEIYNVNTKEQLQFIEKN
ncbi:putative UDP-N-acetylglucosamine pyrophosphorylase [Tupanvirus deep ocean]|uniref:UDP-N-acetylglucosamine pyrophosphorylase n=2 Tax=Tupanvirus TaxID=2094720 RepID=A0AC62A9R4_9VIRU|nr:putative UDP-N-acetylglucosamine pyrophosphorylase [Tupanvirus deep ocean]QKU34490.1 putative UDP-N-acetylglucosamine pyrophosphorylase [Tupanvirus deep ocean]